MEKLKNWAAAGGTLSLSSWVSYYPSANISDCLGTEISQVTSLTSEISLKPGNAGEGLEQMKFGSMSGLYRAHLRLTTAEAAMTDENGDPVMTVNKFGKGRVFHSGIPFEFSVAKTAWGHRTIPAWKIYGLLKKLAGISYDIEADHPSLERGILRGKDGSIGVFVNHENTAVKSPVRTSFKPSRVLDLTTGREASFVKEVRLEPNGVKVYKFVR